MFDTTETQQYLWLAVLGTLVGFLYAFGIGANDVANAFATTVASKALTLRQAICVAAVFEFAGAMLLGGSVTQTVRSDIFDTSLYLDKPDLVMLGFFTSLVSASISMLVATHYGIPVSSTHTIVGSIMGFSVAAKGIHSINWNETKNIFISWFASPIITGIVGFVIFWLIRFFILMANDPFTRGYYSFSLILFCVIALDIFFILTKGTSNFDHFQNEVYDVKWVLPTSLAVGLVAAGLWFYPVGPIAKRRLEERKMERENKTNEILRNVVADSSSQDSPKNEKTDIEDQTPGAIPTEVDTHAEISVSQCDDSTADVVPTESSKKMNPQNLGNKLAKATVDQDLAQQAFEENEKTKQVWENMTHYDYEVEQLFTFVQVFTAAVLSFAHGANDVANAIAPDAAILAIYHGNYGATTDVPLWLLAIGGLGIVLGLALYGYKVMKTIGFKLAAISPSRGSSANLAASLMVSTASYMGLPVSTTQCIVGAIAGVGAAEGLASVQWLSLAVVVVMWVIAFFATATFSAGLFALGAYFHSMSSGHVY